MSSIGNSYPLGTFSMPKINKHYAKIIFFNSKIVLKICFLLMSEYRVLFVQRLFSFYQSAVAIIPAGISIYNLTADYTFSVIKYILIV